MIMMTMRYHFTYIGALLISVKPALSQTPASTARPSLFIPSFCCVFIAPTHRLSRPGCLVLRRGGLRATADRRNQGCHKGFFPVKNISRWKLTPWNLCLSQMSTPRGKLLHTEMYASTSSRHQRSPICFLPREPSSRNFIVVTVCDLFAIAKFLVDELLNFANKWSQYIEHHFSQLQRKYAFYRVGGLRIVAQSARSFLLISRIISLSKCCSVFLNSVTHTTAFFIRHVLVMSRTEELVPTSSDESLW